MPSTIRSGGFGVQPQDRRGHQGSHGSQRSEPPNFASSLTALSWIAPDLLENLKMTTLFLAAVPLLMMGGFLTWLMTMGARDQARADAWAAKWVENKRVEDQRAEHSSKQSH